MEKRNIEMPDKIDPEKYLLKTTGPIIGSSVATQIGRLVYIAPKEYGVLPMQERHAIARLVGEITHTKDLNGKKVEKIIFSYYLLLYLLQYL